MTVRALAGIAGLNLAYALAGLSLLWGIRGFRTWSSVLRLAGLGYLLGVAAFGVVWTALLVVGIPFGGIELSVSLVALGAAGVGTGLLRGAAVPQGIGQARATPILLVTAVGIALAGLFLSLIHI